MELDEIRQQIDKTDDEILKLFDRRMDLCGQVADYKAKNGLPVFQGSREKQILDKIAAKSPENLEPATRLLFSQIMEISKCLQREKLTDINSEEINGLIAGIKENPSVACPGISGSYTEEACVKIFGCKENIEYFDTFGQVFEAVAEGKADYGIVPIENSTAGGVSDTYDLLERQDMYICARTSIRVKHVLAAKKGNVGLKKVLSHEQALHQCAGFIKGRGFAQKTAPNTSIAARTVAESDDNTLGCICSAYCAELNGLEILERDICDNSENYTRFIVISKTKQIDEKGDIISVCLSLPHTIGSLYKLLTRFYFCGLNLTKIESRPMPPHIKKKEGAEGFEVIFYLDFEGSLQNPSVAKLLTALEKDCGYYRFLGNYRDLDSRE